jgi:signal transduction histidine kinase
MRGTVGSVRERLSRWSLRRRTAVGFGMLGVLTGVMIVISVLSLIDVESKGNDVVNRWQPAVARSQAVLTDLVNQETGVRGFALGGQTVQLEPYQQGIAAEQVDEAALRSAFHGKPVLQRDLDALVSAARGWQAQTARVLITAVQNGESNVAARLDSRLDKARFDDIRLRAAELTRSVQAVADHARRLRANAADVLIAALSITGAVVVLAGVFVWRGLHSWVLRPMDALGTQTRLVAFGEIDRPITPAGPPEFLRLSGDVEAMRERIADELATTSAAREELSRSNADLEQFAYVASHDLSEPLRKVANFSQLLERQYGEQLDDRARQYIAFAVDGAKRMQTLIGDLLALSRVGRSTAAFVEVDTAALVTRALATLDRAIAEAAATVDTGPLPTVHGDPSLLVAVFENLIGNAVKYRRPDVPPRVEISATHGDSAWQFRVTDNGIGIDAQYAERIFAIFQRLHLRDEYAGTGIGLALCRRIVEFHGGEIRLDTSHRGSGASFLFTIPDESRGPA